MSAANDPARPLEEILQAGPMYPPPRDTHPPRVHRCGWVYSFHRANLASSTTVICHSNGQKTKGHAVFNDCKPTHNATHTTSRFSSSLIRSSTTRSSRSIVRVFPSISFPHPFSILSFFSLLFFLLSPLLVHSGIFFHRGSERAKTSPICLSPPSSILPFFPSPLSSYIHPFCTPLPFNVFAFQNPNPLPPLHPHGRS